MALWATFQESMAKDLRSEANLEKVLDGTFEESGGRTLDKNFNCVPL